MLRDGNVINARCEFFVFCIILPHVTVEYGEQDLVAGNYPDNALLYSPMGSIGHYTDWLA